MEKPITSDEIELPSTLFRELLYDELLKSIRFMKEDYPPDLMARIRDEIDYALATLVMDVSQGSVTKATRIFGMSKMAVWNLIRKFDIDHNVYKRAYKKGAYGKGYLHSKKK